MSFQQKIASLIKRLMTLLTQIMQYEIFCHNVIIVFLRMQHEYTDKMVTPWGGMKEMKILIDKTGIINKLTELGLPEGKSNNSIDAISIIESFWVSIYLAILLLFV